MQNLGLGEVIIPTSLLMQGFDISCAYLLVDIVPRWTYVPLSLKVVARKNISESSHLSFELSSF
jgi:hypothetical protein